MKTPIGSFYRISFIAVLFVFRSAVFAQCGGTTNFYVYLPNVYRVNTNSVQSTIGGFVTGDYWWTWAASASGTAYRNGVPTHAGSVTSQNWGQVARLDWYDAPSVLGPGNYSVTSVVDFFSWLCEETLRVGPYTYIRSVQKPTITQSNAGEQLPLALWNLGPGTADAIPTSFGYTYRQKITLTIDKHCDPDEFCNDGASWTINSPGSTLVLSSTTGNSVFLQKGPAMGNCSYDTPVSVRAGAFPGFSSDSVTYGVNSPGGVESLLRFTEPYFGGYRTHNTWHIKDVCALPGNDLTVIPGYERFGPVWTRASGVVGWPDPTPEVMAFDDEYTVDDKIWAFSSTWTPNPVFTSAIEPYVYTTVLLQNSQMYFVGSGVLGSSNGVQVYSGTIRFYQDHGDTR